jgi:hypothetical protein
VQANYGNLVDLPSMTDSLPSVLHPGSRSFPVSS